LKKRRRVPGTYAGPKKGKPMMWSQCMCDMKMFTTAGRPDWRASTCAPKGRAPLPMSHTKYCSEPVSNSTHDECPPKVCERRKSSSCSTKAIAFSRLSSWRPCAATSACDRRSRRSRQVSDTGIEPRVPQNLMRIAGLAARVEGRGRRRRDRAQGFAHRREDLEHQVEAADLEDLGHHRAQRREHDAAALGARLLGGQHEAAQAGRGHVFQAGEVEHDVLAACAGGLQVRLEPGAEELAVVVVQPAGRR